MNFRRAERIIRAVVNSAPAALRPRGTSYSSIVTEDALWVAILNGSCSGGKAACGRGSTLGAITGKEEEISGILPAYLCT